MRKKLPGKCEVIPEVIGHFEIIGDLSLAKEVRDGRLPSRPKPPRNPSVKTRRRILALERIKTSRLHLHADFSFWKSKFNVPTELADKMRLGRRYKIQCTIVEVKEDAES